MIYKTGTKITCKDDGQVFVVTESTAEVTKYRNGAIQGECPTPLLADRVFELGELLKGDNKAEAHAIAKELTELGQQVANAAAYVREELDQILNPKKEPTPCA